MAEFLPGETLYYKRILRCWLTFRLSYLISRILLQFCPNSILLHLLLYPILRYPLRPLRGRIYGISLEANSLLCTARIMVWKTFPMINLSSEYFSTQNTTFLEENKDRCRKKWARPFRLYHFNTFLDTRWIFYQSQEAIAFTNNRLNYLFVKYDIL